MNRIIIASACLLAIILSVTAAPADQVCLQNEVFNECGSSCPEHCPALNARGELETQALICNRMCNRGCFCASGYVKDLKRNGECVARLACSPP